MRQRIEQVVVIDAPVPPSATSFRTSPTAEPEASGGVPHLDWHAQAEQSARDFVREQERAKDNPLYGTPEILVIPERPKRAGDTEVFDDGVAITWVNERCKWVRDPLSLQGGPMMICKDKTLAERRAEARRAEMEKAMKPKYLKKPLPRPTRAAP